MSTGPTAGQSAAGEPPGLREQVDLARAELSEIADEVKRVALLGGIAAGLLLFLGVFLPVGLLLFLGDWLFGSIGWGVLVGTELLLAIALTCVAVALGVSGRAVGAAIGTAFVVGVIVAVPLALALTNAGWTRLGDASGLNVELGVRPLVVAVAAIAVLGAVLGLLSGLRAGGIGGAIGGIIGGAILGAIVGALTAIRLGTGPGAALGAAVGLGTWAGIVGAAMARQGFDKEAMKARFWPDQTIETTKETIEWVRERTPLGPRP